jgi:hypothetical protein
VSILSDFFVATPNDALEYESLLLAAEPVPNERFTTVSYQGFTSLELGFLWAHLERQAWDVERHGLEHVSHGEEGETWLERFPDEFVRLLSDLEQPAALASLWAQHEELNAEPEDLMPFLGDLKRLAQLAQSSRKALYLWGSL